MAMFFSGLILGLWLCVATLYITGNLKENAMREAFERGHAVQCLGQIGYYWECGQ